MVFGGIPQEYTLIEKAGFVVIPVPYDLTTCYQSGSRRGPAAIVEASCQMELYDEELDRETYLRGIHTALPLEPCAAGPREMMDAVRREISGVLERGKIPVMLGGEHSISIGAVQAMKEARPGISVLHLDAHADMRESYQGTPFSHACVARRVSEMAPIVQVGIRSMSAEEASWLREQGRSVICPGDLRGTSGCLERISRQLTEDVYLTVDLDVLDPSVMPATGTPEPDGLTWAELLAVVREIAKRHVIRGFDVVELCPIPGMVAPDFAAAKLVYRIMGYLALQE
ncbi:MAG TPA: agmatinase [Syntrophales bacterium]|nr:agmatinase [Syntrophales bacterium]HPX10942.1 agmatinase [Syntrophales bacterium]HQB29631.1 agmatinase [Syntrophales bacterium]HQN77436.1 agmatinase [Syntrophales bacterium]HQQ28077.1 agmatinase [Syntrophales bacterium]